MQLEISFSKETCLLWTTESCYFHVTAHFDDKNTCKCKFTSDHPNLLASSLVPLFFYVEAKEAQSTLRPQMFPGSCPPPSHFYFINFFLNLFSFPICVFSLSLHLWSSFHQKLFLPELKWQRIPLKVQKAQLVFLVKMSARVFKNSSLNLPLDPHTPLFFSHCPSPFYLLHCEFSSPLEKCDCFGHPAVRSVSTMPSSPFDFLWFNLGTKAWGETCQTHKSVYSTSPPTLKLCLFLFCLHE